jgi:predicted GNAT family acetyltransferase
MRTGYFDMDTRAIVSLDPVIRTNTGKDHTWIVRVNTPERHRNRGLATRLMEEVCADADKEKVILYLGITASGPLDGKRLAKFYARFGFVFYDQHSASMVRNPR